MGRLSIKNSWKQLLVYFAFFAGSLGIEASLWLSLGGIQFALWQQVIFWAGAILVSTAVTGLSYILINRRRRQETEKAENQRLQLESAANRRRLEGVIQLNRIFINAQNEAELVDKSLEIIARIVGTSGISFVPYDEWGQPLHTFTYSPYSTPGLRLWLEQVSSSQVRDQCQACKQLGADVTHNCLLMQAPLPDVTKLYCLPVFRNQRAVGVVNLYLAANREIDAELREYLDLLLNEMTLALEMTRLRNQELITLQQLQLAGGQPEEIGAIVAKLIEGLRDTLDFCSSRVIFRSAEPHFSGLNLTTGNDPWLNSTEADEWIEQVAHQGCVSDDPVRIQNRPDGSTLLALPFNLPEGTVIGAMLLTGGGPAALSPRQLALIETVTTQTALLVENERRRLESEYRTVIQERVRLAREIHDSLAQTLAYLKLTSAQMQAELAQGDLTRLAQNLTQSHEALTEAYLETREAIDNLRFAPQQDMVSWLGQITRDFEQSSTLKVTTNLPAALPSLSPEVQAQLVRIVQEALSNIRKHSRASRVWLDVRLQENYLSFDVADDGIGFSSEDVPDVSRHGLRGMRERAELIGAEFQITSHNDRGTTIHLEIPIQPQETLA